MLAERLSMRKVREVLRLKHTLAMSYREIFRSCLGILSLLHVYGTDRVEAACRRGNDIKATSYGSIASILKHGLDKAFAREPTPDAPPIRHGNIRGSGYFH